jgi:hypothetical protein
MRGCMLATTPGATIRPHLQVELYLLADMDAVHVEIPQLLARGREVAQLQVGGLGDAARGRGPARGRRGGLRPLLLLLAPILAPLLLLAAALILRLLLRAPLVVAHVEVLDLLRDVFHRLLDGLLRQVLEEVHFSGYLACREGRVAGALAPWSVWRHCAAPGLVFRSLPAGPQEGRQSPPPQQRACRVALLGRIPRRRSSRRLLQVANRPPSLPATGCAPASRSCSAVAPPLPRGHREWPSCTPPAGCWAPAGPRPLPGCARRSRGGALACWHDAVVLEIAAGARRAGRAGRPAPQCLEMPSPCPCRFAAQRRQVAANAGAQAGDFVSVMYTGALLRCGVPAPWLPDPSWAAGRAP